MAKPAIQMRRLGRALLPIGAVDEGRILELPDGMPLSVKVSRPRSRKVHATFFQVIKEALAYWPPNHEPYPGPNEEDKLRAWLLCRTGQHESYDFPLTGIKVSDKAIIMTMERLIEKLRNEDRYAFVRQGRVDGDPALRVFVPLSIRWDDVDETEFRPIKDAVFAEIEHIIGCEVKHLLKSSEGVT
jgi:hypothetical protein